MKVSVDWIKEYMPDFPVNSAKDAEHFSDLLALTSTEVEENGYQIPQSSGLIVGRIDQTRPIENSTHLKIAIVNVGKKDYQIVTGAPNVKQGQLVVLALPGARLFDGKKIEATDLDGEISQGMLVSLQEIGFDDSIAPKKHEAGIYVFPDDGEVKPGDNAVEALGINDLMINTELTANRGDMLSIRGNLYEFSAILNKKFSMPELKFDEGDKKTSSQISVKVNSDIADPYYLRVLNDVEVKTSPLWLQKRLWNSGIRPINNIVDATNYVMFLLGQPLHAFDLDKLPSRDLKVDLSKEGEEIVTLDGQLRKLGSKENIVVYSGDHPEMLAGVMGGKDSEVSYDTKNIVLESASFDPALIRKTAQRFNLHSQASQRFERLIDPSNVGYSVDFAAALIKQLAGGEIAAGRIGSEQKQAKDKTISISLSEINNYLGTEVSIDDVADIWKRLAFDFEINGDEFIVNVPARRTDINIKADLYEEFVRIYGYDKVPLHLPKDMGYNSGLTHEQRLDRSIRSTLMGFGLNQVVSYSLTDHNNSHNFAFDHADSVPLIYPISKDREYLRQSILGTLIDVASYNYARKVENISLFEMGHVFKASLDNEKPIESQQLAALVFGQEADNWQHKNHRYDFYYIKGLLESLLDALDLSGTISFHSNSSYPLMHPGRTADVYINKKFLGFVGQISPRFSSESKLPNCYVFQIDLDLIHTLFKKKDHYQPINKFPSVQRDISLLVGREIESQDIEEIIKLSAGKYLSSISVIDLYQGREIQGTKKSISYRLTFLDPESTLTDNQVNQQVEQILLRLKNQLGVQAR